MIDETDSEVRAEVPGLLEFWDPTILPVSALPHDFPELLDLRSHFGCRGFGPESLSREIGLV